MQIKQQPFFLIAISIVLGLTLPTIIQDGMFMDGMLYTCVSKNLANGIGSFWFPIFSKYGFEGISTFHEHPPLVFAIESVFFKVLGDGMYTERIYILFTIALTCILILAIWKHINKGMVEANIGWLPLIFWIIIPVCFWSFSNNMHENTMGIFILLSVLFYLKSLSDNKSSVFFLIFSGVFVFFATFSKGIPGFYPIAIPLIYWLTLKKINFKKVVFHTFVLSIVPILIYCVLILFPDAKESLSNYFIKRVLHRIGENPTVDSHFYIFGRIVLELLPPIGLTLIIFLFNRKKFPLQKERVSLSLFFIVLGFAGVLPLMLTMVQKGFYFIPSLPFFAIGFALLISEPISFWSLKVLNSKHKKWLSLSAIILLSSVIIFSSFNIGKKSRDEKMLMDVYEFGKVIPKNSLISVSAHRWNDWPLQCYLIRYFNISVDLDHPYNEFRILDKDAPDTTIVNYKKINLPTQQFDLYQKK